MSFISVYSPSGGSHGGLMVSELDQAAWIPALAGVIVLCS